MRGAASWTQGGARATFRADMIAYGTDATLQMVRGGKLLPPLEAPHGAGHQLTAAAVPLWTHMTWAPL